MSISEVITIAKAAGFQGVGVPVAVAIAMAESSLNQNAVGDVYLQTVKWGPSVGLWQIRSLKPAYLHLEPIRNYSNLFDPAYNAKAAFAISKGGTDFSPWSTYLDKKYLKYLDAVKQAAPAAAGSLVIIAAIIYFLTR